MGSKLTLLYQNPKFTRREYYHELFGPWIDRVIDDGTHTVVMDNCIVSDQWVECKDPGYYRHFRGLNAFLLLGPDENYLAPVSIYENFRGIFRSHYSAAYLSKRVKQIPVGYNPGFENVDQYFPASQRRFVWSFFGEVNKSTRPDCLRSMIPVTPNFWFASDDWRPGSPAGPHIEARRYPRTAMYEVLNQSSFAPCPMGNVSQETPRVYEALQAGAIPVLEKRRLMDVHRELLGDHPLPTFFSWKEAAAFVADLRQHPAELDNLQQQCLSWWAEYKRRLCQEIGDFLERLQNEDALENIPHMAKYTRIPKWSWIELWRHHTFRALGRTLRRKIQRAATGRRTLHLR